MAGLVTSGPTIRGVSTGPLARQQGHLTLTGVLVGNDKLVSVLRQTDKYVTSSVVKLSLRRGIKLAKEAIQDAALRIPSPRSFGVYASSLTTTMRMQERFVGVATVGNLKAFRRYAHDPGPSRRYEKARGSRKRSAEKFRPTVMRNRDVRRPAKYWHFVEFGVYGHPGHRLVSRAVKRATPRLRATLEATAIEVLSRHFNVPPLIMSAAIHAQKV